MATRTFSTFQELDTLIRTIISEHGVDKVSAYVKIIDEDTDEYVSVSHLSHHECEFRASDGVIVVNDDNINDFTFFVTCPTTIASGGPVTMSTVTLSSASLISLYNSAHHAMCMLKDSYKEGKVTRSVYHEHIDLVEELEKQLIAVGLLSLDQHACPEACPVCSGTGRRIHGYEYVPCTMCTAPCPACDNTATSCCSLCKNTGRVIINAPAVVEYLAK